MAATAALLSLWAMASAFAFGLFAWDKERARSGGRRVPERTLLWAALFGGVGAVLGQRLLRHKTRKQPFATWLAVVVVAHLAGVAAIGWRTLQP